MLVSIAGLMVIDLGNVVCVVEAMCFVAMFVYVKLYIIYKYIYYICTTALSQVNRP